MCAQHPWNRAGKLPASSQFGMQFITGVSGLESAESPPPHNRIKGSEEVTTGVGVCYYSAFT